MSLLKSFKNVLVSLGMEEIAKPIFYNSKIAIRFNVGDNGNDVFVDSESENLPVNPNYITACMERALKIYNSLKSAPDILAIEGYILKDKGIEEFVSSIRLAVDLPQPDEISSEIICADKAKHNHLFLLWNLKDFCPERLFREIILADLDGNPFFDSSVYFVCTSDNVLFHLYDDRGADLVADKKEKIQHIYYELNDLILDYNREEIDNIFKTTAE